LHHALGEAHERRFEVDLFLFKSVSLYPADISRWGMKV
jgi:hypothetical protein